MKLKGIIFDVHRTLVDDSGFPRERIWKLMREAGANFDLAEYYRLYDRLTKQLFNWAEIKNFITVRDIHRKRLTVFYQQYQVRRNIEQDLNHLWREMGDSKIYPEVPEVLDRIKGKYKIGLLTNADNDDPLIEILLKTEFAFDAIITSESVKAYKPQPIIFQEILTTMNYQKDEVLFVGDSQISDVLGGKNFGIPVVWLNRKNEPFNVTYPLPDYQISDLRQLINII